MARLVPVITDVTEIVEFKAKVNLGDVLSILKVIRREYGYSPRAIRECHEEDKQKWKFKLIAAFLADFYKVCELKEISVNLNIELDVLTLLLNRPFYQLDLIKLARVQNIIENNSIIRIPVDMLKGNTILTDNNLYKYKQRYNVSYLNTKHVTPSIVGVDSSNQI